MRFIIFALIDVIACHVKVYICVPFVSLNIDIIALDMSKPHLYPDFDTPALLTCSAQAGDVCMTMVDGNILYENGEFKTLDEGKVRADMQRAVERLYRK